MMNEDCERDQPMLLSFPLKKRPQRSRHPALVSYIQRSSLLWYMPKVETAPKIDGNLSTASERLTQDASWNLHGASHSIVQFIAAYLLAVIIFGLDVFLHRPLLAVLYIVPVALAGFWSRSNQPSRVVVVTGFCTLLVGAGLLVLPSLDSILLTDRLLVLATIWITAILSLLRKKQEELDLLRGMGFESAWDQG